LPKPEVSTGRIEPATMPDTVDAESLKAAIRHHAAGVAVVTADVGDGPVAMTISSLTSVSVDPAVLMFSVSSGTGAGQAMTRALTVVVHLLEGSDHELAVRCATRGLERFSQDVAWEVLPTGEPVFCEPRIRLRGQVLQRIAVGDSTVLVLAVTEVLPSDAPIVDDEAPMSGPLAYHDRAWHVLSPRSRLHSPSC
jgi:flavin reductase (DIM6/NTAB) family NADH-FMN oxidoreductase RutF